MLVRPAVAEDSDAIWQILEPVIREGETYTFPRDWTEQQALTFWFAETHEVFIAEDSGQIVGTYFLRPNQTGGGSHVANCGYVTSSNYTGRGVARAMCRHSLEHAKVRGFLAMQFNFVITTNTRAIALWQSFDFKIAGQLPGAFQHPKLGFVDALIMYRTL